VGETKTITHGFKMLFLAIFRDMSRKGYCVTISRRRSQYYCVSHLSSRRINCGLTMQVSFVGDKLNMRPGAVPKGVTPEVFGRHLSIIRIYDSKIKTYAVVYSWGCRSPRVGKDLGRSSNVFHDLQYATSQNNTRSGREVYLRTCDGGL